jgi:hypothetical protein
VEWSFRASLARLPRGAKSYAREPGVATINRCI